MSRDLSLVNVPIPPQLTWQTTHLSPAFHMGTYGRVCVGLWRAQPDRVHLELQRDRLLELQRGPVLYAYLCVIEEGADPPQSADRELSVAAISRKKNALAAVACVVGGDGFRSAIARTALSGMTLLLRDAPPVRVFGSVADAAPWLGQLLDGSRLAGLAAAVHSARAAMAGAAKP